MSKRLFDLVISGAGLILLAVPMLLIALLIRLDSQGPIFYRQTRVGRGGMPFQIRKFRSMRVPSAGEQAGPLITVGADPRITRIGGLLRKSKLDELPQLINVLFGEMSLVGPRPEVPKYVELYPEQARAEVLSVRPGITDDAAIEFCNESELLGKSRDPERTYVEDILPRKIEHYRRYVQNRSLSGDFAIVLRTLVRLVSVK